MADLERDSRFDRGTNRRLTRALHPTSTRAAVVARAIMHSVRVHAGERGTVRPRQHVATRHELSLAFGMGAAVKHRAWTFHWQFRFWTPDVNRENVPIDMAGSNVFRQRGVSVGDSVYIVSLNGGQLYLGGRMTVKEIVSRAEAVRRSGRDDLFDASEWIVDFEGDGTPLDLHRKLETPLTKQIRFRTKDGPKPYKFVSSTHLDNQTTRGVRELTSESAELLDRVIDLTDTRPRRREVITVNASDLVGVASRPSPRTGDAPTAGRITTTIKREWLREIAAGRKTVEYRELKKYWTNRLAGVSVPFELRLINGMSKNPPEVTVLITSVRRNARRQTYELHIGKVLSVRNWDRRTEQPAQG